MRMYERPESNIVFNNPGAVLEKSQTALAGKATGKVVTEVMNRAREPDSLLSVQHSMNWTGMPSICLQERSRMR